MSEQKYYWTQKGIDHLKNDLGATYEELPLLGSEVTDSSITFLADYLYGGNKEVTIKSYVDSLYFSTESLSEPEPKPEPVRGHDSGVVMQDGYYTFIFEAGWSPLTTEVTVTESGSKLIMHFDTQDAIYLLNNDNNVYYYNGDVYGFHIKVINYDTYNKLYNITDESGNVGTAVVSETKEPETKEPEPDPEPEPEPEPAPNDHPLDNPTLLVINQITDGIIDSSGQYDGFKLELNAGETYIFETSAGNINDTQLFLYDTDAATVLADNDDKSSDSYYSKIEYKIDNQGTYYLLVRGYGDYTGSYKIKYSLIT